MSVNSYWIEKVELGPGCHGTDWSAMLKSLSIRLLECSYWLEIATNLKNCFVNSCRHKKHGLMERVFIARYSYLLAA